MSTNKKNLRLNLQMILEKYGFFAMNHKSEENYMLDRFQLLQFL